MCHYEITTLALFHKFELISCGTFKLFSIERKKRKQKKTHKIVHNNFLRVAAEFFFSHFSNLIAFLFSFDFPFHSLFMASFGLINITQLSFELIIGWCTQFKRFTHDWRIRSKIFHISSIHSYFCYWADSQQSIGFRNFQISN